MLVAGGAVAMASFAMSLYLLSGHTYSIKPNERLVIQQFVSNSSQGVYSVSFPLFEGQPYIQIVGVANQTIVEEHQPPISRVLQYGSGDYRLSCQPAPDAPVSSVLWRQDRSPQSQVI